MRRHALSLAAAISLAAGRPALASHHAGGAHSSVAPKSASAGPSHAGGFFGALRFLDRRRPYGPHNADNTGPPHFYGGRFLGYSEGNPYYCSNGHRVHWDQGVKHWVRWGDYTLLRWEAGDLGLRHVAEFRARPAAAEYGRSTR